MMKKIEVFAFISCPMIFGLVLAFIGVYAINQKPELPHGIILICSGMICLCLFGSNSILAKILEKKSN
jgi:hypothetical protein